MSSVKTCIDCKDSKPFGDFYKLAATVDGFDRRCRDCAKAYRRAHKTGAPDEKKCNSCGMVKVSSGFSKNSNTNDGLSGRCKQCCSKYNAMRKLQEKMTPESRRCNKCGETKSSDEFHRNSHTSDGLYNRCKDCTVKYYQENKDVYSARKKEYRKNNAEKIYEREKSRRLGNLDKYRQYAQKRINLSKGVEFDPAVTVEALRERLGDLCAYCGVEMNFTPRKRGDVYDPTRVTIDHVIPLAKAGAYTFENTRLVCAHDNVSKGDRDLDEWLIWKGYPQVSNDTPLTRESLHSR